MARTGKLSAVEVAKARELGVLHDGGGLYLRVSESALPPLPATGCATLMPDPSYSRAAGR